MDEQEFEGVDKLRRSAEMGIAEASMALLFGGQGLNARTEVDLTPMSPAQLAEVITAMLKAGANLYAHTALLHDSTPGASGAAFPTPRSRHHGVGFRPTQLGHPVEDVTPDRGFSALRLAVPRLQAASEHGLVSEEAVLNARLLSVARLLLLLSSPDLANPLKSRVTRRP